MDLYRSAHPEVFDDHGVGARIAKHSDHEEKTQHRNDGKRFFQERPFRETTQNPQQEGQTAKNQYRCYYKRAFTIGVHYYPHETTTGIDFPGEIVMAPTGQYIRHR